RAAAGRVRRFQPWSSPLLCGSRGASGCAKSLRVKCRKAPSHTEIRRKPAKRGSTYTSGRELASDGRVGNTMQRSGKSSGSWSKTVDKSEAVNTAVTHTGESGTPAVRLP